jgi:hypothetical protein
MKKVFKIIATKQFLEADINIKSASKALPEWYKKIKPFTELNNEKIPTIKKCVPVLDAMSHGYVIYTTEDIFLTRIQSLLTFLTFCLLDIQKNAN